MPTGRPAGSVNGRYHNAGGTRTGAGRKSAAVAAAAAAGKAARGQQLVGNGAAREAQMNERNARASEWRDKQAKEAAKSLRRAVEGRHNGDPDSSDSEEDYGSESDDEGESEGAAAAAVAQPARKLKSHKVMPANGSPVANRLRSIRDLAARHSGNVLKAGFTTSARRRTRSRRNSALLASRGRGTARTFGSTSGCRSSHSRTCSRTTTRARFARSTSQSTPLYSLLPPTTT